tara:strand:+ start:1131 stop:1286 length:156 start_codon:yes stop_codon:yes gene_type:complete
MYSLKNDYFTETFNSIDELINYIKINGLDPNYEITRNNKSTGEMAIDLITF